MTTSGSESTRSGDGKHEVARVVVDAIAESVADAIAACYLCGSATDGGLAPESDLDLLVVLSRPLSRSERGAVVRNLLRVSGPRAELGPARPADATFVLARDVAEWRYPPRKHLVFGEWLRDALERGDIADPADDPDLAILLRAVRATGHPLIGPDAASIVAPVPVRDIHRAIVDSLPSLLGNLVGDERNEILTLARMWTTLATDGIVAKDVAATWVLERISPEHRPVLDLARGAYLGEVRDVWADRQPEARTFADAASAEIRGLYASRTAEPLG